MSSPTRTDYNPAIIKSLCYALENFKLSHKQDFSNIVDCIRQGQSLEAIELTFRINNRSQLADVQNTLKLCANNPLRRAEILRLSQEHKFDFDAVLEALKENDSEILDYFNRDSSPQPRTIAEASDGDPEVKEFLRSYKPRVIGQPHRR